MSGILKLESLTKGNTLKQGDKTPLKYRLFDADGDLLSIAGKSAEVRLVYPDFLTIGYRKGGLTVAPDDTVTFTIDSVIPSRIYHVEIIVDDKFVFPSRSHGSKLTIDKSSLGADTNVIEIVGKDVLIQEVKSQVDTELQPLVTSLESAQQAEIQRASEESSRASAESQRKIDHANRSAELASKADKVVLKNELQNPNFSNELVGWYKSTGNEVVLSGNEAIITTSIQGNSGLYQVYNEEGLKYISTEFYSDDESTSFNLGNTLIRTAIPSGIWSRVSHVSEITGLIRFYADSGADNHYKMRKPIVINLTQTFGAGNEPTKEEMDELIKVTGYIDEEYAINNKEMLIWILGLIRRNKNAIVALGGA